MSDKKIEPYGSWKSPLSTDLIVAGANAINQMVLDGEDIYWIEMRPAEGGRNVAVRRNPDGSTSDINPAPFNIRTRVHEYGGGSLLVHKGTLYFSNFDDQRLYSQVPGSKPKALTPADLRYADAVFDETRERLICIREDHTPKGKEAINAIVALGLKGKDGGQVLVESYNFFSTPKISPDGSKLAWLSWNHPNMPWDGTELWVADFKKDGTLGKATLVAGGKAESIFQPEWSPEGVLHFVSDRTNWWNLYRWKADKIEPLYPLEAEFGEPQWVFGMSTYGFAADGRIICAYTQNGLWQLASLTPNTGKLEPIELPYSEIAGLEISGNRALVEAGSPTEPYSILLLDLSKMSFQLLYRSSDLTIDPGYISIPEAIEYPTTNDLISHAFYYPPTNRDFAAPEGERPPLLVRIHGGPTASASTTLRLSHQYWTSRGWAILDVNYGGSTGYGREYRQRLNDSWGIVDLDDCVNGALYLVERGLADSNRLAIDGGSAGGYTTLAALAFRETFKAGASHFGVSDLEALAKDTHKFESRYLDNLIGPYPERQDLYRERSPIYFTDQLRVPLILFQGLEDKVVPPSQAVQMFEAVRDKGIPVAYLPFEGEQHGFRRAENIKRALEAQYYFFAKVFGFEPADKIEPVDILNL